MLNKDCPICGNSFKAFVKGVERKTCSVACRIQSQRSHQQEIVRHCDNPGCCKEMVLTKGQASRYEKREQERFFCSRACAAQVNKAVQVEARAKRVQERGNLTIAAMEEHWQRVQDPTYYTGIRYRYATPLSFRDKGIPMARSTGARS